MPAEKGDPRNLTNTPGVMEREPQWSPDGKSIAYLSDESGEYALHLRPQNGAGDVKKIALKPGSTARRSFRPDSKKIALVDSFQRLWYRRSGDDESRSRWRRTPTRCAPATSPARWSPDSKWLAYSKVLPNELSAIHLYSLADAKSTQVTDGYERRRQSRVRQGRQVSVLHGEHELRRSLGLDIHAVARTSTSSIYLAFWTRRSPLRSLPRATRRKRRQRRRRPPMRPSPMPPRRGRHAAQDRPSRRNRSAGREDRPRWNRPAHPLRADAAAAIRGSSGGQRQVRCWRSRWPVRPEAPSGPSGVDGPSIRPEGPQERRAAHRRQHFQMSFGRREGAVPPRRELDDRRPAPDGLDPAPRRHRQRRRRPERRVRAC